MIRTARWDKWMRLFVFEMIKLRGLFYFKIFLVVLMVEGLDLRFICFRLWEILIWQIVLLRMKLILCFCILCVQYNFIICRYLISGWMDGRQEEVFFFCLVKVMCFFCGKVVFISYGFVIFCLNNVFDILKLL